MHLALLSHNTGGARKKITTKPIGTEDSFNHQENWERNHVTLTMECDVIHMETPKPLTQ